MSYNPYDPIANILAGFDLRLRQAEAGGGIVTPLPPVFTAPASISSDGTPQVGETLIGQDGVISYANSYARRWLLGSTLLTNASAFTPLVAGDYRFEVDATGPGGTTTSGSNITVTDAGTGTPTPTPTPTLTATPAAASIAANVAAGTLISNIGNVPAGVTPTVTPNDGRFVIAGDATAGWKVVTGMSALSAGSVSLTVAATGANPATVAVTITAAVVTPFGVAFAGSSTPQKYFDTFAGPSNPRVFKSTNGTSYSLVGTVGQGAANLGNTLANALNRDIQFLDTGVGGTTASAWEAAGSTLRANLVNAINARGGVNALVIGVGFNDARTDKSVQSAASHATLLRSLYGKIRTETNLPNLPIFIIATQKYTEGDATAAAQTVLVRSAELMVAEDANTRLYAHVYDLAQVDGIHMADGRYTTHAARGAAQILAFLNNTVQVRGPKLISAVAVSPTQTDVTLQYVSGTDFTPTNGLSGFQLSKDGFTTTLAITAAVRQSATAVRLTHTSTGTSAVTAGVRYMQVGAPDVSAVLYANTSPVTPPDPTILSLSFQTIPDTVTPAARTAKVNHNYAGNATVATYTDFTIPPEASGSPSANINLSKALVDDTGTATPWTMTITQPFTGTSSNVTLGGTTGSNSGIAPDAVLLSYWYLGDSTQGNTRHSPAVITLSGLNPAKLYDLSFVGSRGAATARLTDYSAVGANTKSGSHANQNNTTLSTILTDMQPDTSGNIVVTITAAGTGAFGYINETKVTEKA